MKYKYKFIHKQDVGGCGDTAFYYSERPYIGAVLDPGKAMFLDGHKPTWGELVVCGSCGVEIYDDELQAEAVIE